MGRVTAVGRLAQFLLLLFLGTTAGFGQTIRVTTWNLGWFPDGSPKGAPPEVQEQKIWAAAELLTESNPDVVLLQEMRDYEVCERLAKAMGPENYSVAICSAFKEPFAGGSGIGKQQVAILTKKPVQAAWAESWHALGRIDPPRGFAFAWLRIEGRDVGIYCVHLKSNFEMHPSASGGQKNILKRELATEQIVSHLKGTIAKVIPSLNAVIVGGDFNTNPDQMTFVSERTLENLTESGFLNCWERVPLGQRVTHPGRGKYPDSTFDYLFSKACSPGKPVIARSGVSDHLPITCDFTLLNFN